MFICLLHMKNIKIIPKANIKNFTELMLSFFSFITSAEPI